MGGHGPRGGRVGSQVEGWTDSPARYHTYKYLSIYLYVCLYVYLSIHMYLYIYIYIHIHIYINEYITVE